MTETWRQWEGRTVGGKYLLGNYLGGSGTSGVFRTRVEGEPADAIIRLVASEGAEAERQVWQWKTASELRHPNLVRILTVGSSSSEGRELVYAVEEYAEENLAEIVPMRALTAEEVRGVLEAALGALEYVHGKGMALGRVRPASVLAAGDQIKLSSDSLRSAGELPQADNVYDAPEVAANGISAAGDVWSLGITLVEVLTQHVPAWDAARMSAPVVGEEVPEPFRGIARRCLEIEPAKRCGLREIRERLEARSADREAASARAVEPVKEMVAPSVISATRESSPRWPYWLAAAVVAVGAIFLFLWSRSSGRPGGGETSAGRPTAAESAPVENATAKPRSRAPKDDIVERVMPEISPGARRTIEGTIKIRVKVIVDADGNVTEATLKTPGPSKYFARVSLEAARKWKFAPARDRDEKRAWTVLFVLKRAQTEASATRTP